MHEKRARTRHWRTAWVIFDRYMQRRGAGRASVRYISKATGLSQRAVVAACRELTDWGYTQRIVGSGSRPSEYMPNWTTTPPLTTTSSPDFGVVGGTHEVSTIAPHEGHTKSFSGTHGDSESDLLLTGVKAGLVGKEVSASGPDAEAPAEAGGFERIWCAYGRLGNKQASKRAFEAIAAPDVDHIASRAAAWAASAKPGQRRMPLEKWLAAEKYDEADRSVRPRAKPEPDEYPDEYQDEEVEVARRITASASAEIAEQRRRIERSAVEIAVPRNVSLIVVSSSVQERNGDKWMEMQTDQGRVAVLLEGRNEALQRAGQDHFNLLSAACGLDGIEDSAELHGKSFMVVEGTFAAVSTEPA
ncbi:hypothetical protein SAMN05216337_100157 [Bradyrhizobium brasilense]|uniref:Helix-turn-helix domain-containing protein n=2 Tax=Bradyrhizobium brasilense TaxID=1419277 RepID=A0A1G6I7X4_9BRAD|nr:hypothetical protein SAMN05216337_100157 [Bradyrhizobium brasilense]